MTSKYPSSHFKKYWQTLVGIICLILIMLENEHTQFMMCSLFLPERDLLISLNAIPRNGKYTDFYQYSLTVSKRILFKFICCPHDSDHFSSISNSLAKLTVLGYTFLFIRKLFFCLSLNFLNIMLEEIRLRFS